MDFNNGSKLEILSRYGILNNFGDFKLIHLEEIKDINSVVLIFEHKKFGVRVLKVFNNDVNNGFCVGFKTPVSNSKGIPHILEHSVLEGTLNNPSLNFYSILQYSIVSHLNAYTYPDKTIYLFSSVIKEEFLKVMNYYLDFVFKPIVISKPELFMKEGWRYELPNSISDEQILDAIKMVENSDYNLLNEFMKDLRVSGIVLNEMLGNYSSVSSILEEYSKETLFKGSNFMYDSGGFPLDIIDLTYEEFIDFYNSFYNPDNAFIYLYGNNSVNEELNFLSNYFKDYANSFKKYSSNSCLNHSLDIHNSRINKKKIIKEGDSNLDDFKVVSKNYFSSNPERDKVHFSYSFKLGEMNSYYRQLSLKFLKSLLFTNDGSKLKLKLLDSNLFENFEAIYNNETNPSFLQLNFYGLKDESSVNNIVDIINSELNSYMKNGFNKDLIENILNQYEIDFKKEDYSDSLYLKSNLFAIEIFESWLFEGNPIEPLRWKRNLNLLKKDILSDSQFLKNLVRKYFVENSEKTMVILKPNSESVVDLLEDKVKDRINNFSIEKKVQILRDILQFRSFLKKSSRVTANLPKPKKEVLHNSVLKDKSLSINFTKKEVNVDSYKFDFYFKESELNEVNNIHFFFKLPLNVDILQKSALLTELLDKMGTESFSDNEFSNFILKNTSGFVFDVKILNKYRSLNEIEAFFEVEFDFLSEKSGSISSLLGELFNKVRFKETKIKQILYEIKSELEESFLRDGHKYSLLVNSSCYSQKRNLLNKIEGVEFYLFIKDLISKIENDPSVLKTLKEELLSLYKHIFLKSNLKFVTFLKDFNLNLNQYEYIGDLVSLLNDSVFEEFCFKEVNLNNDSLPEAVNSAVLVNSNVFYNSFCFKISKKKYDFPEIIRLIIKILNRKYIQRKIRFEGGAYAFISDLIDWEVIFFVSYRDPHLERTYDVFKNAFKYGNNIDESDLLIGVIALANEYLYPYDKFFLFEREVLFDRIGLNKEIRNNNRSVIFEVSVDVLKDLSVTLLRESKSSLFVSLGNKNLLLRKKSLFKRFIKI